MSIENVNTFNRMTLYSWQSDEMSITDAEYAVLNTVLRALRSSVPRNAYVEREPFESKAGTTLRAAAVLASRVERDGGTPMERFINSVLFSYSHGELDPSTIGYLVKSLESELRLFNEVMAKAETLKTEELKALLKFLSDGEQAAEAAPKVAAATRKPAASVQPKQGKGAEACA